MLMRFDPFRDVDRLTEQAVGALRGRDAFMPLDAYRRDDSLVAHLDLPGVKPTDIEVTVEKNVLSVSAQRSWEHGSDVDLIITERPQGKFSRQLFLNDSLDSEHIVASYDEGVLTVTIPVAEKAKPRRVTVSTTSSGAETIPAEATSA